MTPQRSDLQLAPFLDAGNAIPARADRTDCHIRVTRINRDTIAAASRGRTSGFYRSITVHPRRRRFVVPDRLSRPSMLGRKRYRAFAWSVRPWPGRSIGWAAAAAQVAAVAAETPWAISTSWPPGVDASVPTCA